MKKIFAFVCCLVMLFTLAACGNNSSDTPGSASPSLGEGEDVGTVEPKVITLSFAHQWQAGSVIEQYQFGYYFKMLEEELGGRYKFEVDYYPSGTLLSSQDIYQGVVDGLVDMGATTPVFFPDRFLKINAISCAGVVYRTTAAANSRINIEFIQNYCMDEIPDVHLISCFGTAGTNLHTRTPFRTLADIQGKTLRASGAYSDAVSSLGATPTVIDMGETFAAAQKGLVSGSTGASSDLVDYNTYEVFPYTTYTPALGGGNLWVLMNIEFYNSLPEEVQTAIDNLVWKASALGGAVWDYNNREAERITIDEHGQEFITLDPAVEDEMMTLLEPLVQAYADKLTQAGYDGEELIAVLGELSTKYNLEYNEWSPDVADGFDFGPLQIE